MAKNRALGRGLSNLLSEGGDLTPTLRGETELQELPVDQIDPNPLQPRQSFNPKELEELAETLQAVGLIEPVIVRKVEERYQLISGERRWRAAQRAGFKKIPAILKQATDLQALEIGIIENIQREDLNPVEEARAYQYWLEQTQQKPSDLAKKMGKDRSTVTNLVRLLKLPEEVLELLKDGTLTPGQARPLLTIGDRQMLIKLAHRISIEKWTARRVEDMVAQLTDLNEGSPKGGEIDPNIANLERQLRTRFTADVRIEHKKNGGGKIQIHYANLDDLDRILELLQK